ncbi:hypothetical protein [Nocardia sp. NPDC050710]|uniref:hypothetical protein n=1 Tax=Nocardia sp. NPDC050710 TaxID=3157220 RepID=UPI0033EE9EA1
MTELTLVVNQRHDLDARVRRLVGDQRIAETVTERVGENQDLAPRRRGTWMAVVPS